MTSTAPSDLTPTTTDTVQGQPGSLAKYWQYLEARWERLQKMLGTKLSLDQMLHQLIIFSRTGNDFYTEDKCTEDIKRFRADSEFKYSISVDPAGEDSGFILGESNDDPRDDSFFIYVFNTLSATPSSVLPADHKGEDTRDELDMTEILAEGLNREAYYLAGLSAAALVGAHKLPQRFLDDVVTLIETADLDGPSAEEGDEGDDGDDESPDQGDGQDEMTDLPQQVGAMALDEGESSDGEGDEGDQ